MNWIPFKQWRTEEGIRQGVRPDTIARWVYDGRYAGLRFRRNNARVVFVRNGLVKYALAPRKGEIRLHDWVTAQAEKEHVSRQAIWMRILRGKFYGPMKIRRISRSVQFYCLTIPSAGGGCAA